MKKKTRILLAILSVIVVLLIVMYLIIPTKNSTSISSFILQRRLLKLLVIVIVSIAIPISTISFQTVVQNRFLTPGVLGIESFICIYSKRTLLFRKFTWVKCRTVYFYLRCNYWCSNRLNTLINECI